MDLRSWHEHSTQRCRCWRSQWAAVCDGRARWSPGQEECGSLRSRNKHLEASSRHEYVPKKCRCVCGEWSPVCGGRRWWLLQLGLCGVLQPHHGQVDIAANQYEHREELRRCCCDSQAVVTHSQAIARSRSEVDPARWCWEDDWPPTWPISLLLPSSRDKWYVTNIICSAVDRVAKRTSFWGCVPC